jgi:hypothetical protein
VRLASVRGGANFAEPEYPAIQGVIAGTALTDPEAALNSHLFGEGAGCWSLEERCQFLEGLQRVIRNVLRKVDCRF